jgi:hypothetical protein
MAMEVSSGRRLALKDIPLLINGDDAVFRGTQETFRIWKLITNNAGLVPSLGKVYVSREFLNINSQTFVVKPQDYVNVRGTQTGLKLSIVKYINLGLLKGLKRSEQLSVLDSVNEYGSIGSRHRFLHENTPEHLWEKVNKSFHNFHWKVLSEAHVPWYVPESYGGLGLVGEASEKDLVIARAMINRIFPKQPLLVKDPQLTQIHKVASSLLPRDVTMGVGSTTQQQQQYRAFMSKLYMFVVYCRPSLIKSDRHKSALELLNHNRHLWRQYEHGYARFGTLKPFTSTIVEHHLTDDGDDLIVTRKEYQKLSNVPLRPLAEFL